MVPQASSLVTPGSLPTSTTSGGNGLPTNNGVATKKKNDVGGGKPRARRSLPSSSSSLSPPTLWSRLTRYMYLAAESPPSSEGEEEEDDDEAAGEKRPLASNMLPSLPQAYHSVHIPTTPPPHQQHQQHKGSWRLWWRKAMAYVGPGYMVAVGYMDPGNWATDLQGGAQFGYSPLFVVLLSCLLAMFLQVLALKLGVAAKRDLAQQCRASFSPRFSTFLWVTAEIAICATDLAEVIGSAIALKLLFGLPMTWGVWLTALDVLLVLGLFERPNKFRILEGMVMSLILVILVAFIMELVYSQPSLGGVVAGLFLPDTSLVTDPAKLYISMGILGATIMPHNIYLHSSIVQTRDIHRSPGTQREAMFFGALDTVVALSLALFVNAAILIVAAATFHQPDKPVEEQLVPSVAQAYHMMAPILGTKAASVLFGVALLASGQNSTLTGTLAGQIIMEGFISVRLKPWLRRLVTRLTVILPAVLTVALAGDEGVDVLLTLSQVVLSLQLPFAVFPLVLFTSDPKVVGTEFANGTLTKLFGWVIVILFTLLNLWLVVQMVF